MKANTKFLNMPKYFWGYVRTISQECGYTEKKAKRVKIPSINEIYNSFIKLGLNPSEIIVDGQITEFGSNLLEYFEYRAHVLNVYVEPRLMDRDRARDIFYDLKNRLNPSCPLPMNKQTGDKKDYAFFTCIINMLIEDRINGHPCDYDPRELTTITQNGRPLRTLARRVDGAFPSAVNPHAIWEIKEYYYTTTFGSRVADGVYETLLDGMELAEIYEHENIKVHHYLMVDSHFTWWECGRSYLCRMVDMLHMGFVEEVFFGYEVIEQLPQVIDEWIAHGRRVTF